MKRLLICTAGLALLAVLAAGVVLWLRSLTPAPTRFTLSDGSVVTFKGATFGTNHVAPSGLVFTRFLPKIVMRWLGQPTSGGSSHPTATPSLVMWFSRNGLASGQNWSCSLVLADDFEAEFENTRFYATYTPTNTVEGIASPYPQRDEYVRVRFYDVKNWNDYTPMGDFTLRNPQVVRTPRPVAPTLPQQAQAGTLEITLKSLAARRARPRSQSIPDNQTVARFSVLEDGAASTNWTVQGMEATDSAGSRLVSRSWNGQTRKGDEQFECKPVLWPEESYKIRFEFSRKPEAPFTTNELWTIRSIAIPTNGGFTLVDATNSLNGYQVRFHGITTQGAQPPWHPITSGEQALSFSISPALKEHRFTLLRITDENVRPINTTGSSYSDTEWGYGFKPGTNTQSLNVTVALHRSRFVEFHAQPTLTTNQMR